MISGHGAGGTSMMMRVMIFGGIEGVYRKINRDYPFINNPYGVFEGDWHKREPEELVDKVFKGLGIGWTCIPEDYLIKMIRIERDSMDMAKSRYRRLQKRLSAGKKKREKTIEEILTGIESMKKRFNEAFKKRKNIDRLDINFDDMFKDTENQVKRIAEFVECPFDIDNAIKAVDKTLDHGDKTGELNGKL